MSLHKFRFIYLLGNQAWHTFISLSIPSALGHFVPKLREIYLYLLTIAVTENNGKNWMSIPSLFSGKIVVKTAVQDIPVLVVVIDILYALPNLFIKVDVAPLADHALRMLTEVCVKQVSHLVADILLIFIYFVLLQFTKSHELSVDKGNIL